MDDQADINLSALDPGLQHHHERLNDIVIDDLAHAMAGPSPTVPGYDPAQTVRALRAVQTQLRCAILILTGGMTSVLDDAADLHLAVRRQGRNVTLEATRVATGARPDALRFQLVLASGYPALRTIDSTETNQP